MNKLDLLRQQIDRADKKILITLKQRLQIVRKVGVWKKQNDIPVLDRKRWQIVLKSKIRLGKKLGLNGMFIKKIYEQIHQEALKIENNP